MLYESLRKELRSRKYRMTAQREIVLKVFAESGERHLGAEDVYRKLLEKRYRISKATVYRTVELLSKLGFLRRLEFGEGVYRYELATPDAETVHQHVICRSCGELLEIDEQIVKQLVKNVEKQTGYVVTDYDVKFFGLCPKCQSKNKSKADESE
ncbi:MAG: Ferric uptake regulator, Fur family [Thermotoga sp. 50_1627]|uniref:Fur family transcriptional regulator n=1 Tax=Pseudothermotoga sp. TaxID=2033661 RepID=UPI00076DE2F0|nr:MAG: Ferric uptake regulator, Fur family [Thermotoga sp. 50_64]KUK24868.1 MAG: Ferric uptake regulator, Fur family [Thermotoga sp. 50_1627]MBC7116902.1 transcriptional repressor [Pseudothermotoga sp.]MDK2923715.1 Fur family transcriptional regulator, ferric uptake regulator [Pseudothermotoga sp.]HCO97248.1 transcriptional repressor [Pseudothermotoga sp.]